MLIFGLLFQLHIQPLCLGVAWMAFKIDVVCVTKDNPPEWWYQNLKVLPVNKLILERSYPLSEARMKGIQKVETEWLLFLDDDVQLCPNWFSEASKFLLPKVGAVSGRELIYGMGKKVEVELNRRRLREPNHYLKKGNRGTTVNTLLRTDVVRDWRPSLSVSAMEDYLLTQHVLAKGYGWLDVKLPSWHTRTWRKAFTAGYRDAKAMKQVYSRRQKIGRVKDHLYSMSLSMILIPCCPWYGQKRARAFMFFQDISCLGGLLFG